MNLPRRTEPVACLALALLVALNGCAAPQTRPQAAIATERWKLGSEHLTADQIGSEVMSFADTYVSRMANAYDAALERTNSPSVRAAIYEGKVGTAYSAYVIASDPNPVVSMIDMTVAVTLKRMVVERYWAGHYLGASGADLIKAAQVSEKEMWDIADDALTPDQQKELRSIIQQWWSENSDMTAVGLVRLSDLNAFRHAHLSQPAKSNSASNILGLLSLDPFAGLDPQVQEFARIRLFAERVAYFSQRMPVLLGWQSEMLATEFEASPGVQQTLGQIEKFNQSSAQISDAVAQWPKVIADQRQAAIEQISGEMTAQRQAIIEETGKELAAQREAAIDQMNQVLTARIAQLSDELGKQREAAIQQFSTELTQQREATVQQLTGTQSPIQVGIDQSEAASQRIVDQAYQRGLILVLIALIGAPVSATIYLLIRRRLVPNRRND
jgi:hypothetical protein